jgi:hypothetical protein
VRAVIAAAAVEGYLRQENHKFQRLATEFPEFSADLLKAVRTTLNSIAYEDCRLTFSDPITGEKLGLEKGVSSPVDSTFQLF